MTQAKRILEYMEQGHKITPLEALDKFGSFRLGAVIFDLKKEGHNIQSKMIELPSGKHVKQYWLEKRTVVAPVAGTARTRQETAYQASLFDIKQTQHGVMI